jgi:Ca-activated chloride channel homolog
VYRDRVIVLVTDGQVGNEDQIVSTLAPLLSGVRVHTVGIDRAVNAGFLGRLASMGGGRCELVESEDRLDVAMDRIHRRIGSPTVTDLRIEDSGGLTTLRGSASPDRLSALFPGVPLVRSGRYQGAGAGSLTISGLTAEGEPWSRTVNAVVAPDRSEIGAIWARARLRDLEDRYAVNANDELEQEIVRTSLRHGVLCRFTAYVAIDARVATDGAAPHEVTQPVELPSGWEPQEKKRMRSMVIPQHGPISVSADTAYGAARPSLSAAPPAPSIPAPEVMAPMTVSSRSRRPRVAGAGGGGGGGVHRPATTAVRTQAASEARLLRASADEPAFRRRDLLEDLVTRLEALLLHVEQSGQAMERIATTLRELIAVLRDEDRTVDERWNRALTVLDELAGNRAERREFWKRS